MTVFICPNAPTLNSSIILPTRRNDAPKTTKSTKNLSYLSEPVGRTKTTEQAERTESTHCAEYTEYTEWAERTTLPCCWQRVLDEEPWYIRYIALPPA